VKVQSLLLVGVAVLLLLAGACGFRKSVAFAGPGVSIPRSKNPLLFKWVIILQVVLGGFALAGAILLHLNKTEEPATEEQPGERPRTKKTLVTMVRDPNGKGSSRGSRDDLWKKSLIGTWRVPLDDYGTAEVTYLPDGRMSGQIALEVAGKKEALIWSGKWDVRDGRICEEIEESDAPGVLPPGRKTKDKILEVHEKEFRSFDAEIGETMIWRRIE
jgi:hypothetical protein